MHSALTLFVSAVIGVSCILPAVAQSLIYEAEPNDTPTSATPFSDAALLAGTLESGEQDGFVWTVSDVAATQRWTFEWEGVPGDLSVVDVMQFALSDDGSEVVSRQKLFTMASRDGAQTVAARDLIFLPGTYLLGLARAGDNAGFRPPTDMAAFINDAGTGSAALVDDTTGAYRLRVEEGKKFRAQTVDATTTQMALPLRLGAEAAWYVEGRSLWLKLPIDDKAASEIWDLRGQVPVGQNIVALLQDPSGAVLTEATADQMGLWAMTDLGLPAGEYLLELRLDASDGTITTLDVKSTGRRVSGQEEEPNDTLGQANIFAFDGPFTGRSGKSGDSDYIRFAVDAAMADNLLTFSLVIDSGEEAQLCLIDAAGDDVQCRVGKGLINLPDLVLSQGEWAVRVARSGDGMSYRLGLDRGSAPREGVEREPNDRMSDAVTLDGAGRISGQFSGTGYDLDTYRLVIAEEAQLWRIQAVGDGLAALTYFDGAGLQGQEVRAGQDDGRLRLENLYLIPGQHVFTIKGEGDGEYTLLAKPLGPPDPLAEREPNDDSGRALPLAFDDPRTGLLATKDDTDMYRFSLSAWDHIRISVDPGVDGAILADLRWDGFPIRFIRRGAVAEVLTTEGVFPPGSYELQLKADTAGDAGYTVSLDRLPRFSCGADCEPNDNIAFANPLPVSGVIAGEVGEWRDVDWYAVPAADVVRAISISNIDGSKQRDNVDVVTDSRASSLVTWDATTAAWQGDIPANTATFIRLSSDGRYEKSVTFGGVAATGTDGADAAAALVLDLDLRMTVPIVAAFQTERQQINAGLRVTNTDAIPIAFDLETATSDLRWRAELSRIDVTLAAGESLEIPVVIHVPADAWSDRPVRISVAAKTDGGAIVETYAEVRADVGARLIGGAQDMPFPDALRGGLNVAAAALGARIVQGDDAESGQGFDELFDGLSVRGQGLQLRGGWTGAPHEIVVDLAGDAPVDVAGFVLNPLGRGPTSVFLRNFDIDLSLDGVSFAPAFKGQLEPVGTNQAFALAAPVPARFARIRLWDDFTGLSGAQVSLGEWKVVATANLDLAGDLGFDIANAVHGGHIVWANPAISTDWDSTILTETSEGQIVRLAGGQSLEWVIGFKDDSTADITMIAWQVAADVAPDMRIAVVDVAASTTGPLGPWLPVGQIVTGDDPTALRTLKLESPASARFLRFTVPATAEGREVSAPEQIIVRERRVGPLYRSVLGEWDSRGPEQPDANRFVEGQPMPATARTRDDAQAIDEAARVYGTVQLGHREEWFQLVVPTSRNHLSFAITGQPTVRAEPYLETEAGDPVALTQIVEGPDRHVYSAAVQGDKAYLLRIEEAPRNIVFAWDTSGSVAPYRSQIYQALNDFMQSVVPGRESVNLMPFGSDLLLRDWQSEPYILQMVLNDQPRRESSSAAETTIARATAELAKRSGSKAIVLITDAATSPDRALWDGLEAVRPRIFGLGLSSDGAFGRNPPRERDLFQDWAAVNDGYYAPVTSAEDMAVGFDRAVSLLRGPADYALTLERTETRAAEPGSLRISADSGGLVDGGAVAFILDASGSMLQRMDGRRKIDVARDVLVTALQDHVPAGTPVALRVFGHKEPNACRSDLEIPLGPLDRDTAVATIGAIQARNLARTPIADSLARLGADLRDAQGPVLVVLVTDGEETCDGDPEAQIRDLAARGMPVTVNIIGFAIDDTKLEQQFETWASAGGGRYLAAQDPDALNAAMTAALNTPFAIMNANGSQFAQGVVNGEAVSLPEGNYRVVVAGGTATFEGVTVVGGQETALTIPADVK